MPKLSRAQRQHARNAHRSGARFGVTLRVGSGGGIVVPPEQEQQRIVRSSFDINFNYRRNTCAKFPFCHFRCTNERTNPRCGKCSQTVGHDSQSAVAMIIPSAHYDSVFVYILYGKCGPFVSVSLRAVWRCQFTMQLIASLAFRYMYNIEPNTHRTLSPRDQQFSIPRRRFEIEHNNI